MPKFEALYYPYFEPPARWLRKHLLVFDTIRTIVPENADHRFSKEVINIGELLSGAFETLPPTDRDKESAYSDFNFERLDKAFEIIAHNSNDASEKLKIIIDKRDGSMKIADHCSLHNDKVTDRIETLLRKYHLINDKGTHLIQDLGTKNFSVVNEMAGDLIMSVLADKMGTNRGWYTVTNKAIDFTVNSLNSFQDWRFPDSQGLLINSILKYEIPAEIELLPIDKYKEIRDAFADLRTPFHNLIINLSNLYRLGKIMDTQILEGKIKEITKEFDREVLKFKKSVFIRNIKSWQNVLLQGLASITSIYADDPLSKACIETSKLAIKSIEKIEIRKDPDTVKLQRFFADTQNVIEDEYIRRFL